jgi:hypothetical protein
MGKPYPRTCSVCGLGGCKNPEAKAEYEDTHPTKQQAVFDVVQKAKHYNVHPSGIEAIIIVRCLNFNMGCAIKYVMRRKDKEYERSLKSAEYYLRDQHQSGNCMVLNYAVFRLLDDYVQAEKVSQVATVYRVFSTYLNMPTTPTFDMMIGALTRVREGNL